MSGRLYLRAIELFKRIENAAYMWINGRQFPPDLFSKHCNELCFTGPSNADLMNRNTSSTFSLEKLMQESFLFAVPKGRRSIEKRLNRKFGYPKYFWKPLVAKTNLLTCNGCGHSYEVGCLCMHCYDKIQKETQYMQDAVQAELGLDPVDKEVVILYKGEKQNQVEEYWEGKRIVELDKERPAWFSKNLLQKSTQEPSTSKDVKPTELA